MYTAIDKEPISPDTFTLTCDLDVKSHGSAEAHVLFHVGLYGFIRSILMTR